MKSCSTLTYWKFCPHGWSLLSIRFRECLMGCIFVKMCCDAFLVSKIIILCFDHFREQSKAIVQLSSEKEWIFFHLLIFHVLKYLLIIICIHILHFENKWRDEYKDFSPFDRQLQEQLMLAQKDSRKLQLEQDEKRVDMEKLKVGSWNRRCHSAKNRRYFPSHRH